MCQAWNMAYTNIHMLPTRRSLTAPAVRRVLDVALPACEDVLYAAHNGVNAVRTLRACLEYETDSRDLVIASYPRSGTTWMQMILYQLLTDGTVDIGHINDVCPRLETSLLRGVSVQRTALAGFRLTKSHLPYSLTPVGAGRYVYVVRHGMDVAVSLFHLWRKYCGFPGSFSQWFPRFTRRGGAYPLSSWFSHVNGWLGNRHGVRLLVVRYEHLLGEFDATVREVATFCDVPLSDSLLARVRERSSLAYMQENEAKLDPLPLLNRGRQDPDLRFVRRGGSGGSRDCATVVEWRAYLRAMDRYSRLGRIPAYRRPAETISVPSADGHRVGSQHDLS